MPSLLIFWSARMINRRHLLGLAGAGLALPLSHRMAHPQASYPNRSIRLVVPRTAGGSVDIIGRGWSEGARTTLGTSYIDNVGGGGGRIGTMTVVRAPPDGHTLLIGSTSEMVLTPLMDTEPYDPIKDFAPVGIMSTSPMIIAVHPSLPVKNLKELAAYANANPGKVSFGSPGAGTLGHVTAESCKQLIGIKDAVHVPYKGGSAAIADLMGGQLTYATTSISSSVVDLDTAGKIRIIAVTSEERSVAMPDLPSPKEQGYPDFVAQFFIGLFAPANVPTAILDRLATVTREAMQDQALRKKLLAAGFDIPESTRASAAQFVRSEITRWQPILKSAGLVRKES
jgi:tripartite-type tricarboxylate transporter receptor subunit TctC